MTPERFQQIVEAYGADPRRWPREERETAQAWAARHRPQADALLADAASIDTWLAADKVDAPGAALQQRIFAGAPGRRPAALPKRRLWWSGAAVAGIGLLGGVAGALAVSFFVVSGSVQDLHDSSYLTSMTSSFGGTSADWSDE